LVAHLAAGAAEEAELIEAHLAHAAERPTRSHEERELPYRALPDTDLRDQLVRHAGRLATALAQLAGTGPTERVQFTGRPMTAADFDMHSRSECSLHRWDLVGRDDVGWEMLGQPELTGHAVTVLTAMSTLPEAPANRGGGRAAGHSERFVLRSAPHEDVVVTLTDHACTMTLEPLGDAPCDIALDPAARLLLLWGRREPSAPADINADGERRALLEKLFAW
jgi:hypothetical protein